MPALNSRCSLGRRFSIAIYQQQDDDSLTSLCGVVVTGKNNVTANLLDGKYVFQSTGNSAAKRFDGGLELADNRHSPERRELAQRRLCGDRL